MSVFDKINHIPWADQHGNIEAIQPFEKIVLNTSVGEVIPIYSVEDQGRKNLTPIKYYKEGGIRSISLQDATIIKTPVGEISAELITFYRDGSLCRIFPLNGKLSGFWTEENEYKLTETLSIPTPVGEIRAKPIYIHFYETGELKSVTFWPEEKLTLVTPLGLISVRKGISFHKCGSLASCEPGKPTKLETQIGNIEAFDPNPNGMSGEKNSLAFSENGALAAISTSGSSIKVLESNGSITTCRPSVVTSMCSDDEFSLEALKIEFREKEVVFKNGFKSEVTVPCSGNFIVESFASPRPLAGLACCTL
ncbi:MAG: hypothetical protein ACI8ZB_003338 [Desulforhopalus sp.]|jgi:hypothetical protein